MTCHAAAGPPGCFVVGCTHQVLADAADCTLQHPQGHARAAGRAPPGRCAPGFQRVPLLAAWAHTALRAWPALCPCRLLKRDAGDAERIIAPPLMVVAHFSESLSPETKDAIFQAGRAGTDCRRCATRTRHGIQRWRLQARTATASQLAISAGMSGAARARS